MLTSRQRRNRLDFAIAHQDWTLDDWERVIWSDETKINRFQSEGGSGYGRDQGKGFWWIERYRGLSSLVVDHS